MHRPNLFKYATSELSQDAFICWLLEWASPEYSVVDSCLHQCGRALIAALFLKHNKAMPEVLTSVDVKKQDNNIDVLCVVNKAYPILIEDKTGTKNHSEQLERYLKIIESRKDSEGRVKYKKENILPIYFKTEDQDNYSSVLKANYEPFLRRDILDVLNTYSGNDSILIDYRERLQSIEKSVESYKTEQLDEWKWHAWIGFYKELQKQLGYGGWGYVANPSGGFLGFWWLFQGEGVCGQNLHLEQAKEGKLCFKVRADNKADRAKLRSSWHKKIMQAAAGYDLNLMKPKRFGNGNYMTACQLRGDFRETTAEGLIDMPATLLRLRKAEDLLKSLREF